MLESLSQVGTNCHKVQNVLVAWGVCSLLTMPQPPWGGGKGSPSPDVRQLRRVWGWGFFGFVFLFMHTDPAQNGKRIIYCVLADTHTHPLLPCNFVYSIMFDWFFFNQRVSVVGGIMAKRKESRLWREGGRQIWNQVPVLPLVSWAQPPRFTEPRLLLCQMQDCAWHTGAYLHLFHPSLAFLRQFTKNTRRFSWQAWRQVENLVSKHQLDHFHLMREQEKDGFL